jgi:hypothetical protein
MNMVVRNELLHLCSKSYVVVDCEGAPILMNGQIVLHPKKLTAFTRLFELERTFFSDRLMETLNNKGRHRHSAHPNGRVMRIGTAEPKISPLHPGLVKMRSLYAATPVTAKYAVRSSLWKLFSHSFTINVAAKMRSAGIALDTKTPLDYCKTDKYALVEGVWDSRRGTSVFAYVSSIPNLDVILRLNGVDMRWSHQFSE